MDSFTDENFPTLVTTLRLILHAKTRNISGVLVYVTVSYRSIMRQDISRYHTLDFTSILPLIKD